MKNSDVKQIKQKISKIKCPTHIKAAMYTTEVGKMFEDEIEDEKYKYYSSVGVYRRDDKGIVEFYKGKGKWIPVDYDIDEALRWDDNFMEITTQDSLDFHIKDWDKNRK